MVDAITGEDRLNEARRSRFAAHAIGKGLANSFAAPRRFVPARDPDYAKMFHLFLIGDRTGRSHHQAGWRRSLPPIWEALVMALMAAHGFVQWAYLYL